jgi:hypothetical protein
MILIKKKNRYQNVRTNPKTMEFLKKFKTQLNVINNKITCILIHFEKNTKK